MGNRVTHEEAVKIFESKKITLLSKKFLGTSKWHKYLCQKCGYIWKAQAYPIIKKNTGCRGCTKVSLKRIEKVCVERNISLLEKYTNSNDKLLWRCSECGSEWRSNVHSVLKDKRLGCKSCNTTKRATTEEEIKERLKGRAIGLIEYFGSLNKKSKWKCLNLKCNHEWETSGTHILNNLSGCPCCNKARHNKIVAERNKELWLTIKSNVYIVKMNNNDEEFYKIGIALNPKKRMTFIPYKHEFLKIIKTNKYNAVYIESKLHCINKDFSYNPSIKFRGYTECFSKLKQETFNEI